ncbi:MAG: hypothetical protein HXY23_15190 [Parvularculaceae bacterium]|nr:hypothetical protein [Parvularculaceae bacterium]
MTREMPLLSKSACECAATLVGILESSFDDIEAIRDAAARATRQFSRCREVFNRFQEECVAVELLVDEPAVLDDAVAARRTLERLRIELKSELARTAGGACN